MPASGRKLIAHCDFSRYTVGMSRNTEQDSEQKNSYQAGLFESRITRNHRTLRKWARKNRIGSYRLYDRDIPEIPLALDLYTFLPPQCDTKISAIQHQNELNAAVSANGPLAEQFLSEERSRTYAHLYLYERPYEKPAEQEAVWLNVMALTAAKVLCIPPDHVITKTRRKFTGTEEGRSEQYERLNATGEGSVTGTVAEQGQIFTVNLTDYLDTGLFMDHRVLRKMLRDSCAGKRVLNLFCYTGSFSVYAAEGGASLVHSVDTSRTYLDWAERNMRLNGFQDESRLIFTRQDAVEFLDHAAADMRGKEKSCGFDIIILDPPTFSNSKRTRITLDINRDWHSLVEKCTAVLNPGGTLYFSTNSRRLKFDPALLPREQDGSPLCSFTDITSRTIPEDFRNSKIHRAWSITKNRGTEKSDS